MTRKEEIEKFAESQMDCEYRDDSAYNGIILGAEWADETLIEKACRYLDANFPEIDSVGTWYKKSFIEEFKKAMEE